MTTFDLLFGLQLSMKILKITDNLSRTLQKQSMSAAEGQSVAELTVKTLKSMRTDANFNAFFTLCNCFREHSNVNLPVLPRKRKAPRRYEIGTEDGSHSATVEDHYRQAYYEVLDLAIAGISDRFNQPGYNIYSNLESLLVSAANSQTFNDQFTEVVAFYGDDFDSSQLSAQLQNFGTFFSGSAEKVSLHDCLVALQDMSSTQKEFFSEICTLTRLILVMPATNAASERSFSTMRRLKTYLQSTMRQSRLNHLMLLNINKQKIDNLDINIIADEFVQGSEHRLRFFGKF